MLYSIYFKLCCVLSPSILTGITNDNRCDSMGRTSHCELNTFINIQFMISMCELISAHLGSIRVNFIILQSYFSFVTLGNLMHYFKF